MTINNLLMILLLVGTVATMATNNAMAATNTEMTAQASEQNTLGASTNALTTISHTGNTIGQAADSMIAIPAQTPTTTFQMTGTISAMTMTPVAAQKDYANETAELRAVIAGKTLTASIDGNAANLYAANAAPARGSTVIRGNTAPAHLANPIT
jgi:hypothetical protein